MAAFILEHQNWVVARNKGWPIKPRIFIIRLFGASLPTPATADRLREPSLWNVRKVSQVHHGPSDQEVIGQTLGIEDTQGQVTSQAVCFLKETGSMMNPLHELALTYLWKASLSDSEEYTHLAENPAIVLSSHSTSFHNITWDNCSISPPLQLEMPSYEEHAWPGYPGMMVSARVEATWRQKHHWWQRQGYGSRVTGGIRQKHGQPCNIGFPQTTDFLTQEVMGPMPTSS